MPPSRPAAPGLQGFILGKGFLTPPPFGHPLKRGTRKATLGQSHEVFRPVGQRPVGVPLLRGAGGIQKSPANKKNTIFAFSNTQLMSFEDITPDYLREQGIDPEGLLFSSNHLPYNPRLRGFSRKLRGFGEKSEAMLWKRLKSRQIGYAFNRQKPILNYIADFYCKELGLVVEIDGASHFNEEAHMRDTERDRQMRAIGLEIVRVLDGDVRMDADRVADYIKEQCDLIHSRL